MDSVTALLWAAVIGPWVAVLVHFWLAYRVAPKKAVEATTGFFQSEEGAAMVGDVFAGWIASKKGTDTIGGIIGACAEVVKSKLEGFFTGAAGNAKKAATDKATALLSNFDFGHPVINGIWSMVDPETKKGIVGRLMSLYQNAAGDEVEGKEKAPASGGDAFKP